MTVSAKGFEARQQSYDLLVKKVKGGAALTSSEISAMTRFEKELGDCGLDLPDSFRRVDEVEQYTGYKQRTIYAAMKKGELTRRSDNSFDRAEIDAWLSKKGRLPQVGAQMIEEAGVDIADPADKPKHSSKKEEAKYRHFRARREEIMVRRLEGELVPRELVVQAQVNRAHEFKTALLLLNRRVSHKIAAICGIESSKVDSLLDAEAKLLLSALCRKVDLHVD